MDTVWFAWVIAPTLILASSVLAAASPQPVSARAPRSEPPGTGVTLAWENDAFAATDRHYTNGVRITLQLAPPAALAGWAARGGRTTDWGLVVGQQMFTPEDLATPAPIEDDRPYAGWLYAGVVLRLRGGGAWDDPGSHPVLDTFEFDIGVVGSWSLAEKTQRFVHDLTGGRKPAGWKHQAREAPALQLSWLRQVRAARMYLPLSLELDVTPHVGVAAGTVLCAVRAGATVRLGRGIPGDFGGFDDDALPLPLPLAGTFVERRPGIGVWLVARADLRASFFDASLDGTPFIEWGHRVQREPLVASVELGIMVSLYERVTFGYTHTLRSPEFRGQGGPDMFGAFTLHFAF